MKLQNLRLGVIIWPVDTSTLSLYLKNCLWFWTNSSKQYFATNPPTSSSTAPTTSKICSWKKCADLERSSLIPKPEPRFRAVQRSTLGKKCGQSLSSRCQSSSVSLQPRNLRDNPSRIPQNRSCRRYPLSILIPSLSAPSQIPLPRYSAADPSHISFHHSILIWVWSCLVMGEVRLREFDNYCLVLSMERLFQHRRNKAVEPLDGSCNLNSLHFSRMSAGMEYSGPLTMRLSDMSAYEGGSPRKHECKQTKPANIKHNLRQLQEKLNNARILLEASSKKKEKPIQPALMPQLKLFTCNEEDESTMNIDSQAFFKMAALNAKRAKDYYVGALINSLNGSNPAARKHLSESMIVMRAGLSLPIPSIFELQSRKVHLERSSKHYASKTIMIELEDTLLAWRSQRQSQQDFVVDCGHFKGYITLRPYALSFLKKVSQHFEIIAFTRFEPHIAKAIIEVIDEEGKYISHLLSRQHCLVMGGEFLGKDLRMFDRSGRDTVIIDSKPQGYMVQNNNGVPVMPFRGGQDRELVQLQRYLLKQVLGSGDVREVNQRWFKLSNYWQYQSQADLIQDLYL